MSSIMGTQWKNMIRTLSGLAGGLILLLATGCGPDAPPPIVPVNGVVLLDGKPLPNAQVRFVPTIEEGSQYIALATTDEQGRFTLTCNGESGACACENQVTVGEADIPEKLQAESAQRELAVYLKSLKNRPIPQKYATFAESDLKVSVSADQQEYKLELSR